MLLSLAVFLACVSNVQGSRRSDCMMQKMLYGRPCNQSPTYFQRPTFIQMKFAGEDNDDYDDLGRETSRFSMNDFNKIRLRFEDDIRRRFDNLEKMIETLGQQFSTSSGKLCSCNLTAELHAMQAEIVHHCKSSHQGIDTTKSQVTMGTTTLGTTATSTITIPSTVSLSTPTPSITTTTTTESPTTTTAFTELHASNLTPNDSNVHAIGKSETTLATIEITTPVVDIVAMAIPYSNNTFEGSATDKVATNSDLTTENIILMVYTPIDNYTIEEFPASTESSSAQGVEIAETLPADFNDTLVDLLEGVIKNDTVGEKQEDSLLPEHVDVTSSSVESSSNDSMTVEYENTGVVRSHLRSTGLVTEKPATEATTEEDSGVWVYVKKPAGKLPDSEYWKIEDVVTLPPPKHRNMQFNGRAPVRAQRKGHHHNRNRNRESKTTRKGLVNAKLSLLK